MKTRLMSQGMMGLALFCSLNAYASDFKSDGEILDSLKTGALNQKQMSSDKLGDIIDLIEEQKMAVSRLNLSENQLDARGALNLSYLMEISPHLTSLNLKDNQINDQGVRLLVKGLQNNTSLKELNLEGNPISIDLKTFQEMVGSRKDLKVFFPKVPQVNVPSIVTSSDEDESGAYSPSTSSGEEEIEIDPILNAVEEKLKREESAILDLSAQKISSDALGPVIDLLVSELEARSSLKTLKLNNLGFKNKDALNLAYLIEENQTLTSLDLSGNQLGDQGLLYLAQSLKKNPASSMKELFVFKNPLTEEGVQKVQHILGDSLKLIWTEEEVSKGEHHEQENNAQTQASGSPVHNGHPSQDEGEASNKSTFDALKKQLMEGSDEEKIQAVSGLIEFYQKAGTKLKENLSVKEIRDLHRQARKVLKGAQQTTSLKLPVDVSLPSSNTLYGAINHVLG